MKKLYALLALLVLIFVFYTDKSIVTVQFPRATVVHSMTPTPPRLSAEQVQMNISSAYQAHMRWQVLWWTLTVAVSLAALGGGGFVVVLAKNKRERVYADPVTGLWPILRENKSPLWKRVQGIHDWIVEDPNLAIAPSRRVYANGSLQITADTHGVPIEQQAKYAAQSWGVQRTVASAQNGVRMNQAMLKAAAGVFDAQARRADAQAQIAENRLLPSLASSSATAQPAYPELTPEQALDKSTDGVAYIGQQADDLRALATWDANHASTLGIFGANGTGKTSSVATFAALTMLRWGWRLYILDGKDAGDWDEFNQHASVEAVNADNIEQIMEQIWAEYQKRRTLMSEYRARKHAELPAEVRAQYPQWGMVFEEFGAVRLQLPHRKRLGLDRFVDTLCKEARYTGWHGVFIDQRPSDYTEQMKGNLKAIACFKLQMNQGHAVNCYHASRLADVGEFEMNGERFKAFHAEPMARSWLAKMTVPKSVPVPVPKPVPSVPLEVIPPLSVLGTQEQSPKWVEFASDWYRQNPSGGPTALARAMWEADGRIKDYTDYKSEAARRLAALRQDNAPTALAQLQAQGIDPNDIRIPNDNSRLRFKEQI